MRILTTDEVRQSEREASDRRDMSTLVLMQRAGSAAAQFCLAHFTFDSVCVVCGRGNNGGTGMVAAESLRPLAAKSGVLGDSKPVFQSNHGRPPKPPRAA